VSTNDWLLKLALSGDIRILPIAHHWSASKLITTPTSDIHPKPTPTMEPATSTASSPTIFTLPVEIRKQILRYAFLAICSPAPVYALKRSPLVVQLLFASDVPDRVRSGPNSHIYGFWGTEPMSRLLRINHQITSEAVDVLYGGDFIFEFSNTTRISKVRFWLDLVGEKKKLVKHIRVSTVINLKMLSLLDAEGSTPAKKGMGYQMEAWACLRRELTALRTVSIYIGFVSALKGGQPGKDRLMDQVMGLVKVFEGLDRVLIDGDRLNEERKSILQACNYGATGVT
jgi:hypothetical protein